MDKAADQALIDRFLQQQLNDKEMRAFDERLDKDETFAKALAQQMAIKGAFEGIQRDQVHQMLDKAVPIPFWRLRRWQITLIVITLLAGVLFLLLKPPPAPVFNAADKNRAMANFSQLEKENLSTSGTSSNWRKLIALGEYEKALYQLDSLIARIETPCLDRELRYYAGVLHLYVDSEYERAEALLRCSLEDVNNDHFRPEVPQYLIIATALQGHYRQTRKLYKRYNDEVSLTSLPSEIVTYLFQNRFRPSKNNQ